MLLLRSAEVVCSCLLCISVASSAFVVVADSKTVASPTLAAVAMPKQRRAGGAATRASLLFTPEAAGAMDAPQICALGTNGLLELCAADPAFHKHQALFAPAERQLSRELQTAEANAKLDRSLGAFLRALSPHFLAGAAHKALEFLIWRYGVHVHNVDAVARCALPYHGTRWFARVAQLLRPNPHHSDPASPRRRNNVAVLSSSQEQQRQPAWPVVQLLPEATKRFSALSPEPAAHRRRRFRAQFVQPRSLDAQHGDEVLLLQINLDDSRKVAAHTHLLVRVQLDLCGLGGSLLQLVHRFR